MRDLKGKNAVITGGASGIGRATVEAFAREGANVFLIDINEQGAKEAVQALGAYGVRAEYACMDVCDAQAVRKAVEYVESQYGGVDIVVNNAGGSARLIDKLSPFAESEQSTWEWVLRLNLLAPMIMDRAVLPHMMKRRSGKILNVGSVAGVNGLPNLADYSAAKGGVIALTHALAKEVAQYGINVNCVSPGAIESRAGQPQTFLKRAGQPWEVAELIVFLCSGDAAFITGQNYLIDGARCLSTTCN